MFEYLEQSTWQEKEVIAENLKVIYYEALYDERDAFVEYQKNKRSFNAKQNYFESVQRLGAITDVLDILHIEWDNWENQDREQ